jgi:basic membrane protein A
MLSSAIKYITPGVADLIKGAKDGTIINGNIFGSAGYAPFHDLEGVVPAEVKTTMEEIDAGLLNETITTNVSDSKP